MVDPQRFSDAVWAGNLPAVTAMIADGADVDAADPPRDPPLHLAVEQQWIEIVRRLIMAGASIHAASDKGWTPLEHAIDIESDAAWQSHHEIGHESTVLTKLLLEAGAVPNERAFKLAHDYSNQKALELLSKYNH
jgi:ankyrin repeat protein